MLDFNNKPLSIGDRVHRVGRADKTFYVVEISDTTIGVSSEKNGKSSFAIFPDKVVKFKNQ